MTSALIDSPYTFTTQAIVRLDPSPGHGGYAPVPSPAKPEPSPAAGQDEATLSHASLLIAHALTLSDVRIDKVAALQQAIASGAYRIAASDIADKLTAALQV